MKGIYFLGLSIPTSSTWLLMLSTIISRMHCQREIFKPVWSFLVMSQAPRTMTAMSTQVVTMVRLIVINPCDQKIVSSGLSFMIHFLFELFCIDRFCYINNCEAGGHKTYQNRQKSAPVAGTRQVEREDSKAHPHKKTSEGPQERFCGNHGFFHAVPEAAEEKDSQCKTFQKNDNEKRVIHFPDLYSDVFLYPLCLPNTTR